MGTAMIYSELGRAGRDLWDGWSGDRGNDDAGIAGWRRAPAGGRALTIRTLFHEAKANGWRDDGMHQKPTPKILERRRIARNGAAQEEAK